MVSYINLSPAFSTHWLFPEYSYKDNYFFGNTSDYHLVMGDYHLVAGDFNIEPSDSSLKEFLECNNLNYWINSNTCFKGISSCIDPILTSRIYSFTLTCLLTVISDHLRKICIFLFESCFHNIESKLLNSRNFNYFPQEDFREGLRGACTIAVTHMILIRLQ